MSEKLNLRQKLVKIYEEIDHIEKAGRNQRQNYNYLRSADVLRAIREAFLKYNIWAEPNFEFIGQYQIPTNSGGQMFAARVKAALTIYDADSDETKTFSGLGDGADGGDKGIYKAQTGAIKNALRNGFLIPDEADPEADEKVDRDVEPETPRIPRPKRQVSEAPAEDRGSRPAPPEPEVVEEPEPVEEAPASISMPSDGPVPDKAGLDKYRETIVNLQKELVDSGGLKQSRGLTVSRKILIYLLNMTGAAQADKITVPQWDTFFGFINQIKASEGGITKLAKLIDSAAKGK